MLRQHFGPPAPVVCIVAILALAPVLAAQTPSGWTATAPMRMYRVGHTATKLADGRVLLAGGYHNGWAIEAELFSPASGEWELSRAVNHWRSGHAAVLLSDGRVLIAGGTGHNGALASTEVWDPRTGNWTLTGSMHTPRRMLQLTRLADGRVLATGGSNLTDHWGTASAEIYDPMTGLWTAAAPMHKARSTHSATALPEGQVLVVGGGHPPSEPGTDATAEIYDPATDRWTLTPALPTPHADHAAALLRDGRVLVVGGASGSRYTEAVAIYDASSGEWSSAAPLEEARYLPAAVTLSSGRVLVTGGSTGNPTASSVEYDPVADRWTSTDVMSSPRTFHTLTLLDDGRVLAAGGRAGVGTNDTPGTADLYRSPFGLNFGITSVEYSRSGGKQQLAVRGWGFAESVEIEVDGVPFRKAAKVISRGEDASAIQRGKLANGKTIAKAIPSGRMVLVTVRNGGADGAVVTVPFTR